MDKKWYKNAKDTLKDFKNLDPDKATKEQFIMYAACTALLDHDESPVEAMESPTTPHSKTPEDYADDELSDAEDYHSLGLDWIAHDELKHAAYWIGKLPSGQAYEYQMRYDNLKSQVDKPDIVSGTQIDELLQDLLTAFVEYSEDKAEYQSEPSSTNKSDMLRKFDSMLDFQRQIFDMLWQASDTRDEHERLREFFKALVKNRD